MTIVLDLARFQRLVGRVWKVLYTRTWNGIRAVSGKRAPLPVDVDGRTRSLVEAIERQDQQTMATIARQVSGIQSQSSGVECASVYAELSGDRLAGLRAMEHAQPRLKGMAEPSDTVTQEAIQCRARWSVRWFRPPD